MQQQPSRVELIDSLRGFALMGLFLIHCVELFELYWLDPQPGPVFDWVFGLFAGKSYALFALTFGLSFFLIMDRARQRAVDFTGRFVWRLVLLLVIGILHGLIYKGDILQLLALLGLLLLLFDRIRSNRLLLAISALFFLQLPLMLRAWAAFSGAEWANAPPLFSQDTTMPVLANGSFADALRVNAVDGHIFTWSFYAETGRIAQVMGLFLVGLVLGRIGFFRDPEHFTRERRIGLVVAAAAWAILFFAREAIAGALVPADAPGAVGQNVGWLLDNWAALALLTVEVLLLIEFYLSAAGPLVRLVAPSGGMALTLHVGQPRVFVPIFYGYGLDLHDDVTQAQTLWIGIIAFALQVAFAHWWFRRFHYGPLEWLWRAGTRTTFEVPFARRQAAAA